MKFAREHPHAAIFAAARNQCFAGVKLDRRRIATQRGLIGPAVLPATGQRRFFEAREDGRVGGLGLRACGVPTGVSMTARTQ